MKLFITLLLYGVALVPMIVLRNAAMGVTAGKIMVFRVLIEGAVLVYALLVLFGKESFSLRRARKIVTHPLGIALLLFMASMAVSAGLSLNPGRAFWGTLERGEGVFGMFHYLILFFFTAWYLTEKEREIVLKIFLVFGYIIFLSGFQEIRGGVDRITSYIGNASFLAGHFLFVMAAAWIVAKESRKKGAWWCIGAAFIPIGILGIFLTGTRSALMGLVVGGVALCFTWMIHRFGKKILLVMLILGILGISGVWVGREKVKTLMGERVSSVETRIFMWEAAWQAFRERPIFGWGGEHFILASSARYNPKAARYGETWFDRAHNRPLDILVSQGIVGGIAFLVLIGSAIWTAWRSTASKKSIAFAFGAAYLTHSMFAPPETISWLGLMVFLGWLAGPSAGGSETILAKTRPRLIRQGGAAGVGMLAALTIWYGNGAPYRDIKTFFQAKKAENPIPFLKKGSVGNTFVRAEAESGVLDFYIEKRSELVARKDTGDVIREEARALMEQEPQDIRHGIRYARILLEQGKENNAWYGEVEEELKKLMRVAPKRQELYYLLAVAQGMQEKTEEAIETAKRAVELDPEVARAHYVLGVALVLSENEEFQRQAEEELGQMEKLDPALDSLQNSDIAPLIRIYESRKRWDRLADMALRRANGIISRSTLNERVFIIALFHFAEEKNKEAFIKVAKEFAIQSPERKREVESVIELAESEKWDIIQSMFEIE